MATEQRSGTIYDLGYRRYDGERLGRGHVIGTLVLHGLRTAFGFGRSGRAKAIPFILTAAALLPAIGTAMTSAASGNLLRLVQYETYLGPVEFILLLFCASQAPELVSTDRKHRVLPLYFSRPMERDDYVASKVIALFLAVGGILLAGQSILFGTRVLAAEVPLEAWRAERWALWPIVATTVLAALLLASLSLALASFLESRAKASAAVVGLSLAAGAGSRILSQSLPDPYTGYAVLANPFQALTGLTLWLFEADPPRRSFLAMAELPGHVYLIVVVVVIVLSLGILVTRYRRLRP